jgi:hypothetical protein
VKLPNGAEGFERSSSVEAYASATVVDGMREWLIVGRGWSAIEWRTDEETKRRQDSATARRKYLLDGGSKPFLMSRQEPVRLNHEQARAQVERELGGPVKALPKTKPDFGGQRLGGW